MFTCVWGLAMKVSKASPGFADSRNLSACLGLKELERTVPAPCGSRIRFAGVLGVSNCHSQGCLGCPYSEGLLPNIIYRHSGSCRLVRACALARDTEAAGCCFLTTVVDAAFSTP